ncbi:MAG: helix-turn-helix transcriptional regulator [Proteobacteria bacterium]|nr:helix-turn-helix transcriptional regulator [Pseudomonadota bacterium]
MATTLKAILKKLPAERQKRIAKRTKALIEQEITLRDLRKALDLTQLEMSAKLHIKQEAVSRLERRSDLLLSTLSSYIEAMGGQLSLTVEFPNRPPMKLTGFENIAHRRE